MWKSVSIYFTPVHRYRLYIAATSNDYDFWAYTDVFSERFWLFVLASLGAMVATKFLTEIILTRHKVIKSKHFSFAIEKAPT